MATNRNRKRTARFTRAPAAAVRVRPPQQPDQHAKQRDSAGRQHPRKGVAQRAARAFRQTDADGFAARPGDPAADLIGRRLQGAFRIACARGRGALRPERPRRRLRLRISASRVRQRGCRDGRRPRSTAKRGRQARSCPRTRLRESARADIEGRLPFQRIDNHEGEMRAGGSFERGAIGVRVLCGSRHPRRRRNR